MLKVAGKKGFVCGGQGIEHTHIYFWRYIKCLQNDTQETVNIDYFQGGHWVAEGNSGKKILHCVLLCTCYILNQVLYT